MQHEPIRVLHMIASLNVGGSQAMVMNLYRLIDRTKVQFDFIIDHPKEVELKKEIESMGGIVYVLPTFRGKNFIEIKRAWNDFFNRHTEYRILHTHSRSYASLYLPIAKKHGLITIVHSHSTSNGNGVTSWIKDIMQLPLRWQADYMFACSEKAGEWLFGKKKIKSNRFRVIPNAIDSEKYKFNEYTRTRIREELGIQNSFVVGHVGRLMPPKNHMFLFSCFKEFKEIVPNAKLLLVGEGNLRTNLEHFAENLDIRNDIIFVGSKTDASDYYQAMDSFVFPSLWEGFGMVVVEAEASGLACLVSDTVPQSVDIGAGLVRFCSLKKTPMEWSKMIQESCREDMTAYIVKSGFDIKDNALYLQSFYLELAK